MLANEKMPLDVSVSGGSLLLPVGSSDLSKMSPKWPILCRVGR